MIKSNTLLQRGDNIVWREIDGAAIVVTPTESMLHELNGTASFLWLKLDEPATPSVLAELLAAEFDIDSKIALADTLEIMQTFFKKGIVKLNI
jgi:hypothetical protein